MSEFVGMLVSSVFLGTMLGMMAQAFSLSFMVSRVFNFAVGQFMILGALMAATVQLTHVVVVDDLVASLLVAAMGAATYLLTLRWPESRGAQPLTLVIITFGVGTIVEQMVDRTWGSFGLAVPAIVNGGFVIDGNTVQYQGLVLMAVAVLVVGAFWLLQKRTVIGKQLVALGTSRLSSRYYGISDLGMVTLAWALSFFVLALAGALFLPMTGASIGTDLTYGVDAFAAAVIGGLGNPLGALAGGLIIAVAETAFGFYIDPNIGDVFSFVLLFGFLVFRPSGITGRASDILGPRA